MNILIDNFNNYFWLFLFSAINNYPLIPLRYYVYKNKLRISFSKIMVLNGVLAIIQGISFVYLMYISDFNRLYIAMHNAFFVIFFISLSCILIKDDLIKIIYLPTLLIPIIFFIFTVPISIEQYLHLEELSTESIIINVICRLFITLLLYPFIYGIIKKYIIPVLNKKLDSTFKYFVMITSLFCVLDALNYRYYFRKSYIFLLVIIRLIIMISCFISTIGLIKITEIITTSSKIQESEKYTKKLLKLQREHDMKQNEYINEIRRTKHDLRHQITYIKYLNDNKNYDELDKYLNNYVHNTNFDVNMNLTESTVLNCIFSHYISIAKSLNINFTYDIAISKKLSISDSDLCILFSNLLENAIEATKILQEDKFIEFNIKIINNKLSIILSNNFSGKIIKNNEEFLSSKRQYKKPGIGISSICNIIEKNNGIYSITTENNIFTFKILLNNMEN